MNTTNSRTCVFLLLWFCVRVEVTDVTWKSYITSLLHSTLPTTHDNLASVITQQLLVIYRATAHCLTQDGNSYRYPPVFDMTRSPCGVIHSVTPPVESITWNISVHNPFYINITLTRINLTDSVDECRIESLQLVWGERLHSERFCGVLLPFSKYIDSEIVNIQYVTEGGNRRGLFFVLYQVLPHSTKPQIPNVYMNLEEDTHDLDTEATDIWKDVDFVTVFFLDLTSVFASGFKTSGHEVGITFRVLPSFLIELLVVNANATATRDIFGLRCHDGPSTLYPTLAVTTVIYWDMTTLYTTGSIVESTAFVMTCTLRSRICDHCKDISFQHKRNPNQKMRQFNVTSFTDTSLPNSQYCSSHLCLLNLTTMSETSVKFTLTHMTLPNIDHSRGCIYEGLAIYEGRKHDLYTLDYISYRTTLTRGPEQLTPIVRICSKVRQTVGAETREDYSKHCSQHR